MNICGNIKCQNEIAENRKYCSLSCRNTYVNLHIRDYKLNEIGANRRKQNIIDEYNLSPNYCLNCNLQLKYKKRNLIYCNKKCSIHSNINRKGLKYNISEEGIINQAAGRLKQKVNRINKYKLNPNYCLICNAEIQYSNRNNKVCSDKCRFQLRSSIAKRNLLGGETNYKKYSYNNISMDSSWEVEIAKWFDINNIKWKRDKKIFFHWIDELGNKRRYHPDFYLEDLDMYIDTKNSFLIQQDQFKIDYVRNKYNLKLLVGSVEYIKENMFFDRMV